MQGTEEAKFPSDDHGQSVGKDLAALAAFNNTSSGIGSARGEGIVDGSPRLTEKGDGVRENSGGRQEAVEAGSLKGAAAAAHARRRQEKGKRAGEREAPPRSPLRVRVSAIPLR